VAGFERGHAVRLPESYRWFVTAIGDGGAGPGYGVLKLGEMDDDFGYASWREGDGFVGKLERPFPFTERWNDLSGRPSEELLERDERAYEAQLDQFEKGYFAPIDGAIPICHFGCAIRVWLVVSGSEYGHLWRDDRASDGGWEPISLPDKPRLTFLDWYCRWVEYALRGEDFT